jgi:hypothetical protein
MNIIVGLIVIGVGTMMVIKSEWLLNNFGRIAWFEEHLGSDGGSRLGYKLVGMLVIFFGMLIMTSMIGGFLAWMLSPLTQYMKQ